jgi:hypothetical protein
LYRTIILPFILYGCETWSATLRAGYRLRVLENIMRREILKPKREEIAGEGRKIV